MSGCGSVRAFPAPMLARSGPLPISGDCAFEVKWDGFRALIRTEGEFRVRSRRGWNMTDRVPELAELPVSGVFDGELVAFGCDGLPSFPAVCQRLLHGDSSIALTYMAFDVLELEGESTMHRPWSERRQLLERLDLNGPSWFTPDWFDDGEALFQVVVDQGLEGIVAKRRASTYRPGQREWVKVKNRDYWRYPEELEAGKKGGRTPPAGDDLNGVTYRRRDLLPFAPLALLVAVAAACGGGDGASKGPRKDIRPQDQARAESIVLKLEDLPQGWRAESAGDDQSSPDCFEPDLSDLTQTGRAESPNFFRGRNTLVSSLVSVYASEQDGQAAYDRVVRQELADCLADYIKGQSDQDVTFKNVSSGRLSFPRLGDRSAAYEIAMELETNGFSPAAYLDLVFIQRGRAAAAVLYFDVITPFDEKAREEFARRVAQRMRNAVNE